VKGFRKNVVLTGIGVTVLPDKMTIRVAAAGILSKLGPGHCTC
jgi:hypothetical protein